ncbi:hypothetical protein BDY19DRAFT_883070 [Irpex rosettiformis]|uniref:Uncharacterized protein n=1 Tax=Irpex rosettiformis TaxID=378272 RepID=A0ACB8UFC3_9APHY|nr:hypothetical protein BDY19DRAFT_883070 [Irpex rosettiformis]
MSAKKAFNRGVTSFKAKEYDKALEYFTEAIREGLEGPQVYDSRAAVYEKQGRKKEALLDSKKVIDLYPKSWQGYARSARLFSQLGKYQSARTMIEMALELSDSIDGKRRCELETLWTSVEAELARRQQKRLEESKNRDYFGQLPVEIAVSIYKLVVEEDHASVVTLSQVCQRWRRVIVSTPSLWSTLSLSYKKPRAKAKLWKIRSQGKLTTLNLRNASEVLRALEDLHDVSLTSLRSLTVDQLKWQDVTSALPHLTRSILDNLETITLTRVDFSLGTHSTPLWLHDTAGLNLHHLIVEASLVDWTNVANHSNRLLRLSSEGLLRRHIPDLIWLLHQNGSLEELQLQFSPLHSLEPDAPPRQLPAQIQLHQLVTLELSGHDRSAHLVLSHLMLPNLRNIKFTRLGYLLDGCLQHLLKGKCVLKLESLAILYGDPTEQTLIELLEAASQLTVLKLSHMSNLGSVLDALTRTPSAAEGDVNGLICPKLTSVDFSGSPGVSDGPIVRLVKGRNPAISPKNDEEMAGINKTPPVARLLTLVIDACEKIEPNILPWLRQQVPRVSCIYATKQQARWKR